MKCSTVFNKNEWVDLKKIIPDAVINLRLFTNENFLGTKSDGYHANIAYMKIEAAHALKNAADHLRQQGYKIVVYDSYRPYQAVKHFIRWAKDIKDVKKKADYYPYIDKNKLFEKRYIGEDSEHLKGGTLDLTIIPVGQDLKTIQRIKRTLNDGSDVLFLDDNTVDMYTSFDYFGEASHPGSDLVPEYAVQNRKILQEAMEAQGFKVNPQEWWHFCYQKGALNQRYDFPVKVY